MVNAQNRFRPKEWDSEIHWDFEIQTDHLMPARRPDLGDEQKEHLPLTLFCQSTTE